MASPSRTLHKSIPLLITIITTVVLSSATQLLQRSALTYAQQIIPGANPTNWTQSYFFGAQSKALRKGVPNVLQLSFQIGSPFGAAFNPGYSASSQGKEFYVIVSGKKNGVEFVECLFAPNDEIKTTDYSGDWGLAEYSIEPYYSCVNVTFDNGSLTQQVKGSITLTDSTGPPAYACGPNTDGSLNTLKTSSSTTEEVALYNGTNWLHIALGEAKV